ncbi:hypothetical protein LXL04_017093 [Taraxacum kok-saghyz]
MSPPDPLTIDEHSFAFIGFASFATSPSLLLRLGQVGYKETPDEVQNVGHSSRESSLGVFTSYAVSLEFLHQGWKEHEKEDVKFNDSTTRIGKLGLTRFYDFDIENEYLSTYEPAKYGEERLTLSFSKQHASKRVFLLRIHLCPLDEEMLPFKLKRKQSGISRATTKVLVNPVKTFNHDGIYPTSCIKKYYVISQVDPYSTQYKVWDPTTSNCVWDP